MDDLVKLVGKLQTTYTRTIQVFLSRPDFEQVSRTLSRLASDIPRLLRELDTIVPPNLHGLTQLDSVIDLSYDEGLPLTWVPRRQIIDMVVNAPDVQARQAVLIGNSDSILDDCLSTLEDCLAQLAEHSSALEYHYPAHIAKCGEWAEQCRDALSAFAADSYGSAQSHAANIVDSIVLHLAIHIGGDRKREHITERAERNVDTLSLHMLGHYLTLRPLIRAYVSWFPDSGVPPPRHFSRHATAHAIGHPHVINRYYALLALMLATSLTRQFSYDLTLVILGGS